MIVLFRSSEAAVSAGSLGDETKEGLRWNGKHKLEIIRKCYLSIQRSLDKNDKIIYTPYEHLVDLFYSFIEATQRMFKMMDKLNIKSDWWLSIYLTDVNVWFYVNLKTRGTVLSYQRMNYKKEQVLKIHSEYFNSHLLFKHHWNNSIISYNLDWERPDDVFDYGLNKALNFLHV